MERTLWAGYGRSHGLWYTCARDARRIRTRGRPRRDLRSHLLLGHANGQARSRSELQTTSYSPVCGRQISIERIAKESARVYEDILRRSMPGESRKLPNSSSWRRPAELGLIVDHSKVILIEQWPALPLPCKSAACQDSFRASQSRIVFADSYRAMASHLRNTRNISFCSHGVAVFV